VVKIVFAKQNPKTVLDNITSSLGGPTLQSMIAIDLRSDNTLDVTITKAGTSHLSFHFSESPTEMVWRLSKQKLAFAHIPFKATIFERLKEAVQREGGKFIDGE
jgi:hypothetical protein